MFLLRSPSPTLFSFFSVSISPSTVLSFPSREREAQVAGKIAASRAAQLTLLYGHEQERERNEQGRGGEGAGRMEALRGGEGELITFNCAEGNSKCVNAVPFENITSSMNLEI